MHRSSITRAVATLKRRMLFFMKMKPFFFGNLSSEGGRSIGFTDRCDQTPASVNPTSNCCNMLIQAASEVLGFLKDCAFFLEWHTSIYEDGCKKA